MAHGSILIVDDSDAARSALDQILRVKGYTVLTAKNGHEALAATDVITFSVVLADLSRPATDSRYLARTLEARGIHTPLILMTDAPDAYVRTSEVHAAASLAKPFDIGLLFATVDRIIEGGTNASPNEAPRYVDVTS